MSFGQLVYIAFRYDDFSSLSSAVIENRLVEIFRRYKAGCTFGVIPCAGKMSGIPDQGNKSLPDLSQEKIRILREVVRENEIEIALHGLYHRPEPGKLTEYAGLPVEEQANKVCLGKNALERVFNVPIATFIPPWNSYDTATIQALGINGIRICCADLNGPAASDDICLLPSSANLRRFREAFSTIKNLSQPQIIVVEYHAFDFRESGSERSWLNLDEFASLVQRCKSQDNLRIVSIKKAVEENKDSLNIARFAANQRLRRTVQIVSRIPLINFSRIESNRIAYWSEDYCARYQKIYLLILASTILAAGTLLFIIVTVLQIIL